jgi:hypothetical protein
MLLLGAAPGASKATASIERAARILADPARTHADTSAAVGAVLDAAVAAAADAHLPKEVQARLAEAQQVVAKGGPPLERAAIAVNESYALLHAGTRFSMPTDLRTMPAVVARMRTRLGDGQRLLDNGEANKAVAVLVEVLAMVFTPMEAEVR